jgi:hypothetical protein
VASTILNANSVNTVKVTAGGCGGPSTFGGAGAMGNVTIPSSQYYTYSTTGVTGPAYTINTGAGMNGAWGSASTVISTTHPSLQVSGDAEFEGNVKIKGKDLAKSLEAIEKRLAILVPDPKKLEKFEALKKAYDHYKLLEALCHETDDDK